MKVYISIPITGYPEANEPHARLIEQHFKSRLIEVVVPHDVQPYPHEGDCPDAPDYAGVTKSDDGRVHNGLCFLRQDIIDMLGCDLVVVADGWRRSRGCRAEVATALSVGIPVREWQGWELVTRLGV